MYYISLAAVNEVGNITKNPCVLDIASISELKGKHVTAINAIDLKEEFQKDNQVDSDSDDDPYEMALNFVKKNNDANFIFDEVPMLLDEHGEDKCTNSIDCLNI